MTKEELAVMLDGRERGAEISRAEEVIAAMQNLVVVFGASDDLTEFRGAIHDEADTIFGGTVRIFDGELMSSTGCESECKWFKAALKQVALIEAVWGEDNDSEYGWTYETTIPHATFDVLEDGEKWCRGIVFDLKDLEVKL